MVAALQKAYAKQQEGIQQKRRFLFNWAAGDFTSHTAERTPAGGIFFQTPGVAVDQRKEVQAGDLAYHAAPEAHDAALLSRVGLYASCRSGELDALAVDEALVADLPRLVALLRRCSRGGFLRGQPGWTAPWGLCLEWYAGRAFSSLGTHVAHLLEVRLWRAFFVARPPKLPRYPAPAARETFEQRERRVQRNEEFDKEVKQCRAAKEGCPAPIGRASLAELVRHFAGLESDAQMRLLMSSSGALKDNVCKVCDAHLLFAPLVSNLLRSTATRGSTTTSIPCVFRRPFWSRVRRTGCRGG